MLDKIRKRVKDHIKHFGYTINSDEEDEIVTLYELNYEEYNENLISLHIENCINRLHNENTIEQPQWSKSRRKTVFAKTVACDNFEIPNFAKEKETFDFLISRLGSNIPFCLLSDYQKKTLVGSMFPLIVEEGKVLIKEGDLGAEMYIVEDGEFDVIVKEERTNKLSSGSVFGELALLHGIPRTATVIATKKSKVWSAEQTSFSCIRIRDQIYRKSIATKILKTHPYFKAFDLKDKAIEELISMSKSRYIHMNTHISLEQEVLIPLKDTKIQDTEIRLIAVKDLITDDFFSLSDVDCISISLKFI